MNIFRPRETMSHPQSDLLEEDLYFEMEFEPGEKENTPTPDYVSSSPFKSVSSLSSDTGSSLRDDRRGSSVGPILERPKYLRICSELKIRTIM